MRGSMVCLHCYADEDARWAGITAPSGVDPAAEQTKGAPLLRNWRPPPNAGLPPALASPIFARFMDAVASTTDPSQADMDAAMELCDIASSYYEYEVGVLPSVVEPAQCPRMQACIQAQQRGAVLSSPWFCLVARFPYLDVSGHTCMHVMVVQLTI